MQTIEQSVFIFLCASLTTLAAIWLLHPLANRVGLVDAPSIRKTHQGTVPLIGGLAIFLGFIVTWILQGHLEGSRLVYSLCAFGIVALGVMDDAMNLTVRVRLLFQTLVSLIMCWATEKHLGVFGDLLGTGPIDIGAFGILVTVIAVIGAINAFNMVDGIDGLAGSLALVSLTAITIMLAANAHQTEMTLALTLAVCLLPYLAANLTIKPFKRKIFMGDAGSMLLGFSIVWLLVQSTQSTAPAFRPVAALWFIAIPLMDMAAIMFRRAKRGQSPFSADRDHLHHMFQKAGYSDRQALAIISTLSLVFAGIGLVGEWVKIAEYWMFGGFVVTFGLYVLAMARFSSWMRHRRKRSHSTENGSITTLSMSTQDQLNKKAA